MNGIIIEPEGISVLFHILGGIHAAALHDLYLTCFVKPEFHIGRFSGKDIPIRCFGLHKAVSSCRLRICRCLEQGRAIGIQTAQRQAIFANF